MSYANPTVLSPSHKSGFTRADEMEAGEFTRGHLHPSDNPQEWPQSLHREVAAASTPAKPATGYPCDDCGKRGWKLVTCGASIVCPACSHEREYSSRSRAVVLEAVR